jgi:hypothetical protein
MTFTIITIPLTLSPLYLLFLVRLGGSTTAAPRSPHRSNPRLENILAKTAELRIILIIDGAPVVLRSHTHPSHSQTSRLLTSSRTPPDYFELI